MSEELHKLLCKRDGEKLLALAETVFVDLSETEKGLFSCLGVLGQFHKPSQTDDAKKQLVIRAEHIVWLLQDIKARQYLSPLGIAISDTTIQGSINLAGCKVELPLVLVRCTLQERLQLPQAKLAHLALHGTHCNSIYADGIHVVGNIQLSDGFKAERGVRFLGATVEGNFDCSQGKFYSDESQMALVADGIKVAGSVFLREDFEAVGEVRFLGSKVDGIFDCSGGNFFNKDKMAISADGIKVMGNIFLSKSFQAEGMLDFVNAQVQGGLIYTHVKSPEKASLRLNHARVGTLWDLEKSWPDPGNLYLDNFEYDRIEEKSPLGVGKRLNWLSRQPEDSYHPQPYEQLAAIYKKSGRSEDARRIQYAKNKHRVQCTREGILKVPWYERFWLGLLGAVVGYGYRPHYALGWWILLVIAGCAAYAAIHGTGHAIPTAQNRDENGSSLSPFSPLFYSLDAAIPLIELGQASAWAVIGWGAHTWHTFENLAGWILVSLFVLTVAGIIRK